MITFSGHTLTIEEVWKVACRESPCGLAAEARPLIRRNRARVESLAADRPLAEDIARVAELLQSETVPEQCLAADDGNESD